MNRLRNAGKTIKCVNNRSKISFLGYTISQKGISLNKDLIEKILKIATPANKKELESFLGLVNFYRRCAPKYKERTESFAYLRKTNAEFILSEKQQRGFDKLKVIMAKKPVVETCDPEKDITLTTDASEHTFNKWNIIPRRTSDNVFIKKTSKHWI